YSRLVGKVNLLSAYNYADRPAEFGELLGELTEQLSRKSHYLLLGNCYELAVSRAVRERKWKQAKSTLNRSRQALEKVESYDRLLLEKWESLLAWHEGKTSALQEFRKKALRARHWESLRETDLWEGLFRKNRALQD